MENHHAINGSIHYKSPFSHSYVSHNQRIYDVHRDQVRESRNHDLLPWLPGLVNIQKAMENGHL